MQKQHIIVITVAMALVLGLYFWGPTVAPGKPQQPQAAAAEGGTPEFNINEYVNFVLDQVGPIRKAYLQNLNNQLGSTKGTTEEHTVLHQLSNFFRDSISDPTLHYFYESRLAELDNTEKSLTFAAHSILGYLPFERDHEQKHWLATLGKQLFDKALSINPANDSTIVGLGGCLMYGASEGAEGNSMAGIMKVREVADKDSTNMFAQYMLGIGGVISQQYDRAALRFEKVVQAQPNNLEAMFKLAETYEMSGQKQLAADWYSRIYERIDNPDLKVELSKRIEMLRNG